MGSKKWVLELVRGALVPKKLYWLETKDTPFDITGSVAKLRVKADGVDEFEIAAPEVDVTDGPSGEITIALLDATVGAFDFEEGEVALQLDSKILQTGRIKIRNFYEG